MATINIQITNLAQIKEAFRTAPALMTKNLNKAIRQTILFIRGESQKVVPVRTGYLRSSAYTNYYPLVGEIGYRANYAIYVHEGTKFMRARPFLRAPIEGNQRQIDKFFTDAVSDTFETIKRETR